MKLQYILLVVILFSKNAEAQTNAAAEPSAFSKNYFVLDIAQSFPTFFSQNQFEPDHAHPMFSYRHFIDENWFMGVGGGFKIWKRSNPEEGLNRQVAIWTFFHEAYRILRLYHPSYLAFGFKLHYLNPTRSATIPQQRDLLLETEIGGAVSLMLIHKVSPRRMASFRIDRWRGMDSMTFHGIEVAFGYHFALD